MNFDYSSFEAENLNVKRQKDRLRMLDLMGELCNRYGVAHTFTLNRGGNKRCVAITIEGPHKLTTTIAFDGASRQPNVFVVSWCVGGYSRDNPWCISPEFGAHDLNSCHRRKATDVSRGLFSLYCMIENRLEKMVAGKAMMLDDREPTPRHLCRTQSLPTAKPCSAEKSTAPPPADLTA